MNRNTLYALLAAALPAPLTLLSTAAVGLLGYGLSLVLFVLALRCWVGCFIWRAGWA